MKISNFEATKIAFYRIKNHLKNSRIKSIFSIYKILLSHKFLVRYRFIGLSNKEIFNNIHENILKANQYLYKKFQLNLLI